MVSAPRRTLSFFFALSCLVVAGTSGCARVADQHTGTGGMGGTFPDGSAGTGGGGDSGNDGAAGSVTDVAPPDLPPLAICGNHMLDPGETCEDGNKMSGDGCSSTCRKEPNYECTEIDKPCTHIVVCGDHMIEGMEECDDGNTASGDGCTMDCKLECGWECPPMAACRAAKCGDGKVAGKEQCDDGNVMDGDGCSSVCLLEGKPVAEKEGWACTSAKMANGCSGPTTCTTTNCGNKTKEGSEQCDDGNQIVGDGCSPFCRLEPTCPEAGGPCTTKCGDGLLLPIDKPAMGGTQECDDGNTVDGDGCSKDCKEEKGFTCKDVKTTPTQLVLPVVYHDFKGWNEGGAAAMAHPDFQHYQGNGRGTPGIVLPALSMDPKTGGVPVHVPMCMALTANLCANSGADATTDWFAKWYVDDPLNKTIVQTLTLPRLPNGSFQFSDDTFFPIDGLGWGNTPGFANNFGFTSAVRYWFEYNGTAELTFVGDDDVWVFINKKLAVDLGGTHQRNSGSVTLDAANGHGYVCDFVMPGNAYPSPACSQALGNGHDVDLGLKLGNVYEIVVFQAERFTTESHYQLTVSGFTSVKSECDSKCGDGVVTIPETCDLGTAMNNGAYGGCNADCTLAPYCGDKIVQAPEECDGNGSCDPNCKKVVPK